jgi:ABC-type cobalt transport system, ATPase component
MWVIFTENKILCADQVTVVGTGGVKILDDVSFTLTAGEKVALIGENGAGKSTLLMSLVGITPIESGNIHVNQIELNKKNLAKIRAETGVVFQNPDDQLFMPKVYDDIAFGPRNLGIAEDEISLRIDTVLEKLGISHLRERMTGRLSGGEKRRIAIATVLVMNPSVLLFDEPSSFLDPKSRRLLIKELLSLQYTQFIATHDLDLALEVCDRVIVLQNGKIQAEGAVKEILTNQELLEKFGLELPLSLSGNAKP